MLAGEWNRWEHKLKRYDTAQGNGYAPRMTLMAA